MKLLKPLFQILFKCDFVTCLNATLKSVASHLTQYYLNSFKICRIESVVSSPAKADQSTVNEVSPDLTIQSVDSNLDDPNKTPTRNVEITPTRLIKPKYYEYLSAESQREVDKDPRKMADYMPLLVCLSRIFTWFFNSF